jgi:putative transposase
MRQSLVEIYLHYVWTTQNRLPVITSERERALYRCIIQEAEKLECVVCALGGVEDHVHLLLKISSKHAPAFLIKQIEGVSSRFLHDQFPDTGGLRWQEGYGVFSVTPTQIQPVIAYIQNQKQHHADGTLHHRWEATDEEYSRPQDD